MDIKTVTLPDKDEIRARLAAVIDDKNAFDYICPAFQERAGQLISAFALFHSIHLVFEQYSNQTPQPEQTLVTVHKYAFGIIDALVSDSGVAKEAKMIYRNLTRPDLQKATG